MNVLRMIKLFGWEKRVEHNVAEKRENELKYIWRRKMLGLANNCVKYVVELRSHRGCSCFHIRRLATAFRLSTWS